MAKEITVYATNWCGDCRRVKNFFNRRDIPYRWIDIDKDKSGEQYVKEVNNGLRSVPTIVFLDGSILVEPSTKTLADKLGISLF